MLVMSLVPIINTAAGLAALRRAGQRLGAWLGILLAVAGVAWVVTEPRDRRCRPSSGSWGAACSPPSAARWARPSTSLPPATASLAAFRRSAPRSSASSSPPLSSGGWQWFADAPRRRCAPGSDRRAFVALIAGAIAGPFLGIWLSLVAVQNARLGIASTLMALPPVILIPVEFVVFRRRVSSRGVIGTLLAFGGVASSSLTPGPDRLPAPCPPSGRSIMESEVNMSPKQE
jgi:drug/metabolite transporter (DMT)-like permease